ncbi:hypothetical protein [Micromonospora inaquosa]|uniref:Uncharacterized protein n=1 Tax=Micromonospora inaquosa TaxID=2203716 RepID=A0A3N9WT17_9ACTN|nr:hypothetical protein DLJ59_11040 [Micromonospora inaquosa]
MLVSSHPVSLAWVFRPDHVETDHDRAEQHAGKPVHAVGREPDNVGRVEVVLADGARVRAYRHEIILG